MVKNYQDHSMCKDWVVLLLAFEKLILYMIGQSCKNFGLIFWIFVWGLVCLGIISP